MLLSHDVYSYVDYARLGVRHGLDPYVHPPLAAPADPAFAHVTWTDATSAYGPLFTLATYPLAWLPVAVAVAVLKAVAALSVLGLAAVVARLAAWRGADPLRAAAFVALNPLVLVHVVGGAHNDGLAMLLAMLGVAAILSAREATGGAALVAAAATKASALFLAPFALRRQRAKPADGPQTPLYGGESARRPAFGRGRCWRRRSSARRRISASAGTGCTPSASPARTRAAPATSASPPPSPASPASTPTTVRAAALTLYAALVVYLLVWTWRATTGSAPPPGRLSACSSPPPGSSPGT